MITTQPDRLAEILARLEAYAVETTEDRARERGPAAFNAGAALAAWYLVNHDIPWLVAEVTRLRTDRPPVGGLPMPDHGDLDPVAAAQ